MRAQEVGTLKAYVNVDHTEKERWGRPLVDYDASCQALYKGIEGEDWEDVFFVQRNELGCVYGNRRSPREQKDVWKMKAAKDAGGRHQEEETKQD